MFGRSQRQLRPHWYFWQALAIASTLVLLASIGNYVLIGTSGKRWQLRPHKNFWQVLVTMYSPVLLASVAIAASPALLASIGNYVLTSTSFNCILTSSSGKRSHCVLTSTSGNCVLTSKSGKRWRLCTHQYIWQALAISLS